MSRPNRRRKPSVPQSLLGYILTLALTVSLAAACLLTLTGRLLTDQALHERVALDAQVVNAQMARIEEAVDGLAAEYHFAPDTVMNLVTRASVEEAGRGMVAWWMGLLGPEPDLDAPFPDVAAIEEAVREDELFLASTEDYMRRTIARDNVAYRVGEIVQSSVMPVRQSLLSLITPHLASRNLPRLLGMLVTARTVMLATAAALLVLILLTQGQRRFLYASAGLIAAFVLLAAVTALTLAANLPAHLAEFSPLLSLQLELMQGALLPGILLTEGALLLVGTLLLALCLRGGTKPYRGKHEEKRP